MMRVKFLSADFVFATLLLICVVVMIIAGIAWARGWEEGAIVMFVAGGFANVPMFHFAMNWPLRNSRKSEGEEGQADEERR